MDKELKQAIKEFRDLPDDALFCPVCKRSRPIKPITSLASAQAGVAMNWCWLSEEQCQASGGKGPRVFENGVDMTDHYKENGEVFGAYGNKGIRVHGQDGRFWLGSKGTLQKIPGSENKG